MKKYQNILRKVVYFLLILFFLFLTFYFGTKIFS